MPRPTSKQEGTVSKRTVKKTRYNEVGTVDLFRPTRISIRNPFALFPLDIILEILGWARPQDLLSLIVTSRSLHQFLLSPACTGIWKRSLMRKGIPLLPPIYSNVKWARLLYGSVHVCHSCRFFPGRFCPSLLRHLCWTCEYAAKRPPKVGGLVLEVVGLTRPDVLELIPHEARSMSIHYFKQDYEEVSQKLQAYEANETDENGLTLADYRQQRLDIMKMVRELDIWSHRESEGIRKAVLKWYHELGFEKSDFDKGYDEPPWLMELDDEDITDQEWNLIYESTSENVYMFRDKREKGERRAIVTKLFYSYLRSITPYQRAYQPMPHDIYDDRELAPLAIIFQKGQKPSEADLDLVRATIPTISKNWIEKRRQMLFNRMASYLRGEGYEELATTTEVDILQLAIAVFNCSHLRCCRNVCPGHPFANNLFIGYDAVAIHHCYASRRFYFDFLERGFETAIGLVNLVGLDPFSTTCADMDKKDARFVCMICSPMRGIVMAFPWRVAVAHSIHKHGHCLWRYRLLSAEETFQVKKQEPDEKLSKIWCCNHCLTSYENGKDFYTIKQHLNVRHDVHEPQVPRDLFVYQASHPASFCR